MEPTNTNPQQPVGQPPFQGAPVQDNQGGKNGNKTALLVIILIVIIVLLTFVMKKNNALMNEYQAPAPIETQQSNEDVLETTTTLESDLNELEIEDVSGAL